MPGRPLTFQERTGAVRPPRQLKTDELSTEIRANLWAIVYGWAKSKCQHSPGGYPFLRDEGLEFAQSWWVSRLHKPLDEFKPSLGEFVTLNKAMFFAPNFGHLFDFIEFALRSKQFSVSAKVGIEEAFEAGLAGWRVSGNQLVPVASQVEAETIGAALAELEESASAGVKSHLRKSSEALSLGKWADSARESIHSVEAAARAFDPKKTLGDIVKSLQVDGRPMHPSLRKALSSFYGYAGDEPGIRHALVDEPGACIGEDEALLLFGMSVSFAQFLVRKRQASDT